MLSLPKPQSAKILGHRRIIGPSSMPCRQHPSVWGSRSEDSVQPGAWQGCSSRKASPGCALIPRSWVFVPHLWLPGERTKTRGLSLSSSSLLSLPLFSFSSLLSSASPHFHLAPLPSPPPPPWWNLANLYALPCRSPEFNPNSAGAAACSGSVCKELPDSSAGFRHLR